MSFSVYVADPPDSAGRDPGPVRSVTLSAWVRLTAEHVLQEVFVHGEQGWYEMTAAECRARTTQAVAAHDRAERGEAAASWAEVAEMLDEVERRTGRPGVVSASW